MKLLEEGMYGFIERMTNTGSREKEHCRNSHQSTEKKKEKTD
jgi:hypothetical protein